ncbi:MAG: hypothetical protein K5683_10155 [Prevotella sp.]|nr:hypothetical protein [Prevotella sp.]
MKYKLIIVTALLLIPISLTAQRRGRKVKKPEIEEPVEDPRITQMLASTQQIVFIDSIIVDRTDYMSHIPMSSFQGKLSQIEELGTFTNEMGDHRLSTVRTSDSTAIIQSSDFIVDSWTSPQTIGGIGTASAINPFLMPDGITLYYAQKGDNSLGGYDIFVTRYDSERRTFLRPENLGMPFACAEANDLFYAIDEFNQLGYFVTDRQQPSGKVCIYIFIPESTRKAYQTEAYSDQQIRSLAAINRIADTWNNGNKQERQNALARLQKARDDSKRKEANNKTEHSSELDNLRQQEEKLSLSLAKARDQYAKTSDTERQKMRNDILNSERQLEQLQTTIRQKEKQIPYNN